MALRIDGGLRRLFRQGIIRAHWKTVETGDTQSGVPDAHVTLEHESMWIEYKRTVGWSVKFQPFQVGFHLTEARHGGRTWIAVRREYAGTKKIPPADELYLVRGSAAERLRDHGLQGLSQGDLAGQWAGGPGGWDWNAVRRMLVDG